MTVLEVEFLPSQVPEFIARNLLDELEQLRYEARMSDAPELRRVPVTTEIVVWVSEHLAEDALALIVGSSPDGAAESGAIGGPTVRGRRTAWALVRPGFRFLRSPMALLDGT